MDRKVFPESQNKVILHSVGRGKTVPSVSPFGLKLETYLKLAKVNYELDTKYRGGPNGRIPWIMFDGTKMGDSHLIIQFLNEKLGINLNRGKPDELLAAARACRIMLEEHLVSGFSYYRFVENPKGLSNETKLPKIFKFAVPFISRRVKSRLVANGIGQHTKKDIHKMTGDDLRTLSKLLGKKNYFGGNEPCEDDCAIFGFLAQCVWSMPGSIYGEIIEAELVNLKQYCVRMKERCWPDWDELLDKS